MRTITSSFQCSKSSFISRGKKDLEHAQSDLLVSQQAWKENTKYETASEHGNSNKPGYSTHACSQASDCSYVSHRELKHCQVVTLPLINIAMNQKHTKRLKKSITVNYTKEQNGTGASCNIATFTEKEKKPRVIFNLQFKKLKKQKSHFS